MKLEELMAMWAEDSQLNLTDLLEEASKTVSLHSKYHQILSKERLRYKSKEAERTRLIHLKHEYYLGDLDAETLKEKGWRQFQKRILKTDIQRYIDADEDIIKLNLELSLQKEKVDFLADIIKHINNRNFTIKNVLDYKRFMNGQA